MSMSVLDARVEIAKAAAAVAASYVGAVQLPMNVAPGTAAAVAAAVYDALAQRADVKKE